MGTPVTKRKHPCDPIVIPGHDHLKERSVGCRTFPPNGCFEDDLEAPKVCLRSCESLDDYPLVMTNIAVV